MKKLFFCALCVLLTALCLTSCASESSPSSASFQAMDTLMSLKVYGSADTCEQLQNKITELDSSLDATDEKSEIFRLNTEKSAVVSKDTAALLSDSLALCDRLDGCFDLTVYPAVQAWGFTTGDYRVPTDSELKTLSDKIDYTAVTLSDDGRVSLPENVMLDLGAVAKGYAADVSRTILAANKAQAAVLNLGGTICLYGKKPDGSRFTVGIADPENPAGYFGYLSCDDTTVATSGGYERYFEHGGKRYIHILDPATAAPVDNGILSVTIVSNSGAFADAASTALFVMGLDKATQYCRSHPGFDCIILTDDKNLYLTEGVYDDFTLSDGYDFTLHKIS
ncbi:FAD:protein FMN transferase [Ruminococcus sp.]|uniref:FAD:protein FMN transferase n=1 Tax=Ruminococcus sp. TaxID=41978 RepID=UPI0038674833